jgi:hypothetical protein
MTETQSKDFPGLVLTGSNPKSIGIILHGIGQQGTDLTLISRMSFYQALKVLDLPHIFLFPQLPKSQGGFYPNTMDPVFASADKIAASKGLPTMYHEAGLSLGGIDVSSQLAHYASKIKTAMTCPGKCETSDKPTMDAYRAIKQSWHYYDPADNTIAYGYASIKTLYTTLIGEGKTNIAFTELPGAGHDVWDAAFVGNSRFPNVVPWYTLIEQIDAGTVTPPVPVTPHLFVDDVDVCEWPSGKFSKVEVK